MKKLCPWKQSEARQWNCDVRLSLAGLDDESWVMRMYGTLLLQWRIDKLQCFKRRPV